ncbi:MAG TPA: multicopper oxidase domain-containing protein, partial [Terracidiphilus sp.]
GKMLGAGEPLRVKQGERVLLHVLNASATVTHWLALPGHMFQVMALDGRPVPTQAKMATLRLGPAERVSAVVEMNQPGVWALGEMDEKLRGAGMGIVVEYAGQTGQVKWMEPGAAAWDYAAFGDVVVSGNAKPDVTMPLVFTSKFEGHGALNRWMINGKSFPEQVSLTLTRGLRHRLVFDNRSMDDHPVHLHRHAFELKKIGDRATSGVYKDVVIVPAKTRVEADVVAANPGPTLFHCHQQDHMDMGFMALFQYS